MNGPEKLIAVVYLGEFGKVERRFPEMGRSFVFERGVPRFVPESIAALFEPNRNWAIGDYDEGAAEALKGRRHVVIRRAVALGDVITTHGAAMGILKADPSVTLSLQTSPMYMPIFTAESRYYRVLSTAERVTSVPIDRIVNMDGLFELDHHPDNEKVSRVDKVWRSYFQNDGARMAGLKPDFSLTLPEADRAWALAFLHRFNLDSETRRGRKLVACATRTVQPARSLAEGLVREFCRRLVAETKAEVVLIEADPAHTWEDPGVHPAQGTTIPQAMALIEHADVLCCMDSGAMWMGHCTATPTVVWLGPTPPETKMNRHPLWPEGVRALEMNKWLDCPACYEAADACSYTFKCLRNPDRERFYRASVDACKELFDHVRPAIRAPGAPG